MPNYVGIFNLPSGPQWTCTPSEWCKEHCYTRKGRFRWDSILQTHIWRYYQSQDETFVQKMIDEIRRRLSIKYVRIHISGDFYSKKYIDKWATIAHAFPDIIFRTNTRRVRFLKYMKKVFPSNVVVRESTDITRKSHKVFPQAAIKGTPGSENFFVCKDNCGECNFYCWHNPNVDVVTSQIR